jgi:uncharacterized integral membrane protein (TIGR00698 family)
MTVQTMPTDVLERREPAAARTWGHTHAAAHTYAHGLDADALLSLGCMEGVYEPVVSAAPAVPAKVAHPWLQLAPGYAIAGGVAALAYMLHELPVWPFSIRAANGLDVRHPVSAAIMAIVVGLVIRNVLWLPQSAKSGLKHVVKKMIPISIVLTGAGLNLVNLSQVGFRAFGIIILSMTFAIVAGYYLSRWLGLGPKTALLLGAGTGICGNSAIVAVSPLIDAEDDDVALSVGTVNLVGLIAMLAWPMIGAAIGLGSEGFGVWSGVSIHAVPQVVAAGFAFSPDAGTLATLVKLVRVTLLAPMVFVLAILYGRRHVEAGAKKLTIHYARLVPWFVWGFVALAVCTTLGLLPTLMFNLASPLGGVTPASLSLQELLGTIGAFILTLSMAAIGLEVNIRQLAGVGARALTAGVVVTAALGCFSLLLIEILI